MGLQDPLAHVNRGEPIQCGSALHPFMHGAVQEALRSVAELNIGFMWTEARGPVRTTLGACAVTAASRRRCIFQRFARGREACPSFVLS